MPLVSNGPVFRPRPGAAPRSPLRRLGWRDSANSGLCGQARRRITQRERGCRGRDPSCRRGEAWGQTRDECFVPCFVAFSNQGTASHFFRKRASLGVALPKRKTAPHFSWKRASLVVALLKRKTAPHFSWKRSSSDRQLSSGRNPNRDSRFRGNDTVGARRRAKLVTPQRAIVRLPVDPRIRKGPGRCRAPLKLSATKLTGRSCQR